TGSPPRTGAQRRARSWLSNWPSSSPLNLKGAPYTAPPQVRADASSGLSQGISQLKAAAVTVRCAEVAFNIAAQRQSRCKRRHHAGGNESRILQPRPCDRERLARERHEGERYLVGAVELMRQTHSAVPHHAAAVIQGHIAPAEPQLAAQAVERCFRRS